MQLNAKMKQITGLMKENGLDIIIVGPSSDLEYLTGLAPHMDERFKALFVYADGSYFYVSPQLCYEETRDGLGEAAKIFVWSDTDGFLSAINEANVQFGLGGKVIGINDGIRAVDLLDIKEAVPCTFINAVKMMEELRLIKDEKEAADMRKAAELADSVMGDLVGYIKPGLTERDIKTKIEELFIEKGAHGLAFDPIIASGPNSSKPHYNDYARTIQEQDIIVLDFGCRYNGYCSDMSRTVFVGEPTEEQKKVYEIVVKANTDAENYAKPGVTAEEVDIKARSVIQAAGYGDCFLNRTGHGIGIGVHEAPYIKTGNKQVLQKGMAFSVEPGIYINGRFGMRVENIVLVTDEGCEVLNKSSKEMIVIK